MGAALILALGVAAGPAGAARGAPARTPGGSCDAFRGAYQLPGSDRVSPAAWTGDGLTVPACGPIPDHGGATTPVYPYPGALWTPGYQCVEFAQRYLYYRFGVTMGVPTNGDQVAAHYAASYAGLFTIVPNGTPQRAPVAGDVLSMSTDPGFNSAAGGHAAVVQASAVDPAGSGTVTIVEENAVDSGVQVLPVTRWFVHYDGFPYLEWLTAPRFPVTRSVEAAYYDAAHGSLRDARWTPVGWRFTTVDGAASALAGHTADDVGTATTVAEVAGQSSIFYADATTGSLREAWRTAAGWAFTTLDGSGSALAGHTADRVGSPVTVAVVAGRPRLYYYDATRGALRHAWWNGTAWHFTWLDGPGTGRAGDTADHVGSAIAVVVRGGWTQLLYYDATRGALRWAGLTGTTWRFATLDGAPSALAGHTGDAVGAVISAELLGGQPAAFYYDATTRSLRHAWLTGSGWQFQTLDGPGSAVAGHTADRVGSAIGVTQLQGNAQLYYYDATTRSLRHAFWTGTSWYFETLDGSGSPIPGHDTDQVGSVIAVTELPAGPQVYYYDATRGSLRHAWWTAAGWRFETLDGPGSALDGHVTDPAGTGVSVTGPP